jgi:hypothetical protein
VRNNAFYHVPSLGRLNLSGNKIYKIEDLAFKVEFIKNIDIFFFYTVFNAVFETLLHNLQKRKLSVNLQKMTTGRIKQDRIKK